MLIDFIRQVNASKSFKIKDGFKFIEFDDITADDITENFPVPDDIEIWAGVKIEYEGKVPESYKVLNLMIGDWVEEHEESLTIEIHNQLKAHFQKHYPNSETADLDNGDTALWMDQLDYMPRINPDNKSIIIEIELVMETEAC